MAWAGTGSWAQAVQVAEEGLASLPQHRLVLRVLGRADHARLGGHDKCRHVARGDVLPPPPGADAPGQGVLQAAPPNLVESVDPQAETLVQGRHLLRQVVKRTALRQPAGLGLLDDKAPEATLEIGDRVDGL